MLLQEQKDKVQALKKTVLARQSSLWNRAQAVTKLVKSTMLALVGLRKLVSGTVSACASSV